MSGLLQSTRIPVVLVPVPVIAEAAVSSGIVLDPVLLVDRSALLVFLRSVTGQQLLKAAAIVWLARAISWHGPPLVMQTQAQTNWCWAAVAASTAFAYHPGTTWTQCALADAELGGASGCCQNGSTAACNQQHELSLALSRAQVLHQMITGKVTFPTLQNELNANRPVGWRIKWDGDGAHFAAIYCWAIDAGTQWLGIEDPGSEESALAMEELDNGDYGDGGTWTHTYLTQS
jgi:hypothetical protein